MIELDKDDFYGVNIADIDPTEEETPHTAASETIKLKQNPRNGMLILDGKGELPSDCAQVLDRIFDHTTKINPMEGLSPEIFSSILENMNAPSGGASGNSKHFSDSARTGIFNAAVILETFANNNLMHYNLAGLKKVLDQMFSNSESEQEELAGLINSVPIANALDDLYFDAVAYLIELTSKDGEEKQSVKSSINTWIAPFFQNKLIRHWCNVVESEIDLIDILNGARYGLLLPKSKFPIAGRVMTTILKKKLYMAVEERGSSWRHKGMSQVFLVVDEAQEVADEADLTIIPMARSWGLSVIFATQNIESYISKHGKDKTMQMMDSLGSLTCLRSSKMTYDYITERIGKDRVWYEAMKGSSLAFATTIKVAMANPLMNPRHPMSHILKFFKVGGVKKLLNKLTLSSISANGRNQYATLQLSEQPMYILQEKEIQVVQNTKFVAFAILQRGGAPRRDVIVLDPKDSNFKSIANTAEKMLAQQEVDFGEVI